jgi:hypothetical protein
MTVQGNGQPKVYRVSQLGSAKQALKWNYEQAKVSGEGSAFLSALRHIYQRLRHDPHGFGEPIYRLPAMKMLVCTGVYLPVVVDFGIHESEPVVIIRNVRFLESHEQ